MNDDGQAPSPGNQQKIPVKVTPTPSKKPTGTPVMGKKSSISKEELSQMVASAKDAPKPPEEPIEVTIPDIAVEPEQAPETQAAEPAPKKAQQKKPVEKKPAGQPSHLRRLLDNKRLLAGLVVGLLLLIGLIWFFTRSESAEAPAAEQQTSQEPQKQQIAANLDGGTFEYSSDKGQSWRRLTGDIDVVEGLWLRTSRDAEARGVISYSDGSELRLDSDTTVKLTTAEDSSIAVELVDGRVYARVSDVDDRAFTVSTDHIAIEAAGTAFVVSSSIAEDGVEVYQGSVSDTIANFDLRQGEAGTFDNDKDTWTKVDLDVEVYKNDNFIVWNRQQDSLSDEFSRSLGILEDLEAPDLVLTTPTPGEVFTVEADVSGTRIEFSGTSEVNALIRVENGEDGKEVNTAADGSFTVTIIALDEPDPGKPVEKTYTVTATDKNGNKAVQSVTISLESATPPEQITLAALAQDGAGVILNWISSETLNTSDGIQVVWNTTGNPLYPQTPPDNCNIDSAAILTVSESSTVACLQDGRAYYFRACRYVASTSSCDVYSNEVRIEAPNGGTD